MFLLKSENKMKLILIYVGLFWVLRNQVCSKIRCPRGLTPDDLYCVMDQWSEWSTCSHQCGNAGTQTRTRSVEVNECCKETHKYTTHETRDCNRNACQNGGTPAHGKCHCTAGWTGTCCMRKNRCQRNNPCQHKCHNVAGSYTCSCYSCYTRVGTRCDLRQCRIGGKCYGYGTVNPNNQCQDCQKYRKKAWTNNNALSCSDGKQCTRNDHCVNGACKGTPFTCRSCERCDGSGCQIKPHYCVIKGKCYGNGNIRSGKPCQQCNSNNPTKWTANNNLKCSDGNVKTKNDRCVNGECRGQPFTCLPCEEHYNDGCRLKSGYCIIKYNNVDTCYAANMAKAGNPCLWCNPSSSTSVWTNRSGTLCDDGEKCTRSDKCQNGQCGGTSFTCNSLCQYCDGNGCSLQKGFGYVAGKCTCRIAGKDYNHQQLNPSNECQWCDLYDKASKTSSRWTNKPAVSCDDRNACTKQDLCQNGRCVGTIYRCRSSYQYSSCIQSSECVGDGTCRDIMRNNGTICRAAVDPCDQPERCDGVLGTCPPQTVEAIKLQDGRAALTDSSFASKTRFQSSTNELYLKLTGFSITCGTLTIKWSLLNSKNGCSLGNNPTNLFSNENRHRLSGLSLKDSERYKVVVQPNDIRGKSGLPVCSSSIIIDTSRPTGGWIRDGLGSKDVQYQSSKAISATWGAFKTTHGIAKYEVAVYNSSGGRDIPLQLAFTNVNVKVSFTKTFSAIADGNNITTKVRAYTKAGLYLEISSNGVKIDTSNPTPGAVSDGLAVSLDLKYANWTTTYDASWTQFTDDHSPIVEYKFGIKRKNGGLISSGLLSVSLKLAAQASGLSLVSGVEYCAVIEGVNAAGLSTQATSNCLLIDRDAPRPGTVNDGTSEDIDHQSGEKEFHANWNGFDDGERGSGVAEYKHKLRDKNNRDITSWTSSGLQTNANITGLKLVNGNTYYITVRAIDKVGHFKDVKSDGVSIDTSHPVYTGSVSVQGEMAEKDGENVVYIRSNDSITVSWPQFVDKHSGMKKYQWNIVEKNAQPTIWKDVPGVNLAIKAVLRPLSLTNNKEYRLTIRGINNAGLHTDIQSPLFIPLSTAPALGRVWDGYNQSIDIDYQTNTSYVHATWTDFDTPAVTVRAYFFAVGGCTNGNYHVTKNQFVSVSPPTTTSYGIKGLTLVNGQRYCVKIKAENLAGVQTEPVSSDGFIVDTTPPETKVAMVLDGSGEDDIDYQSSKAELSATWTGIQDYESGIQHFEVAVSRNRLGEPDVTYFTDVGHNMSATFSGLNLHNVVYYVIVCAINNAALTSCLASDGVHIDPTVSTHGVVHDGILEPDIRYQSSTKKMSANWERIWDLESRVERFEWAIGEEYPGSVLNFVDVGLQTHVTTDKVLALRHGHNYTVFLRVYNRAGGVQELSSNGVIIDTTPPKPSEITFSSSEWLFKLDTGIYYSTTASGIYVTWKDFEERQSEVWYYKWAIGTSKCGIQLQPFINIGLATSANTSKSELKFRPGIPYYVTVIAQNRAHLVSRACSSPVMFEYTPPRAGSIRVTSNTGTKKSYYRPDEVLRVSWSGFEDFESGIERYEIAVMQSNTSMLNYTFSSGQTQTRISLATLPRKTYTISLNAVNYAELETKAYSKPFMIDDTPPVYTGSERNLPTQRFQAHSSSVEVAWKMFTDGESPVEFYEVGIGTQLFKDDVHEFRRTGLCTDFELNGLSLRDNQLYHITVRAYDAAGLVTSLPLETVLVDETPPTAQNGSVKDGLSGNDIDYVSVNDPLSATWENIEDPESGIDMFEYCIGSTPFNCLIKPFTVTHINKSFLCHECKIHADMKVFARIRVTNRAGLSAIFTSNGVFVDSSPPEIGHVLDGERGESPDMEKVDPSWLPSVTWYGAQDIQSGLKECRWVIERHAGNTKTIIYEKTLGKANMTYKVRHTERTASPLQLVSNASYFNVIRCSNNAGVSSYQYSNGFCTVEEWPLASYVSDGTGSRELEYDVIGESIGASWGPFTADSKDPVTGYEWALGTLGTPDDILDFTEVRLETRASLALFGSELELEPGVRYYVTVRATTLSGRTTNKSSNGFIIDRTPPTGGAVEVTHKILNQKTNEVNYMLTWNGFDDIETGIRSYEYCLGYIKDVCSTVLTNAGLDLQTTVQHFIPADQSAPFYGIVIATNNAGLKSIVSSKAIKLDFTPPVTGTVIDGPDEDLDYINASVAMVTKWSTFTDQDSDVKKCTLTIREENPVVHMPTTTVFRQTVNASGSITHKFILTPGLQYISTIECENVDGFKSWASSDGVVFDESPPVPGSIFLSFNDDDNRYQSSRNTLEAYWTPARDPESGINEYLVAVGSGPYDVDVKELFTVGMATEVKIQNLTMNSVSTYYVTLEIVNNAGLRKRVSSYGVTVDETPPIITKVTLLSSQTAPGYIGPGNELRGNWNSYDDESSIAFTEYCIGTTTHGCQTRDMLRLPDNQTSVRCFDCKLEHRHTYFMTIRVWNEAGLFSLASTEGVTVDLTPPMTGKVLLSQRFMPCSETCGLGATFGGFVDDESGINRCEFSVKTSSGLTVTPAGATTTEKHIRANNLMLKHGESYKIAVVCINNLDERSLEVDSSPVRIDNTPPEKGVVIISPDSNHDTRRQHTGCHFMNTTLRVYWTGFHDEESHLTGFQVAIGRAPLGHDIIQYRNVNIDSEVNFELSERYGLTRGDTIFATVEATNGAGLTTKVSSLPTRLISDTDSNLLNERDFLCVNV